MVQSFFTLWVGLLAYGCLGFKVFLRPRYCAVRVYLRVSYVFLGFSFFRI